MPNTGVYARTYIRDIKGIVLHYKDGLCTIEPRALTCVVHLLKGTCTSVYSIEILSVPTFPGHTLRLCGA